MKENNYEIIHQERIICRILDVQIKKNTTGKFVAIKFARHDNLKFIFSATYDLNGYDEYIEAQKNKILFVIDKFVIRTKCDVVHRLTWDDFYNKKCSYEDVKKGNIETDSNGDIRYYKEFEIYATNENSTCTKAYYETYKYQPIQRWITNALESYFEIDSPEGQKLINQFYKTDDDSFGQEEYYDPYCDDELYERLHSPQTYTTPEDRIMSALEDGYGELYGF